MRVSFFLRLWRYLNFSLGWLCSKAFFTWCEISPVVLSCLFASSPKMPFTPWLSLCCVVSLFDWFFFDIVFLCFERLALGSSWKPSAKIQNSSKTALNHVIILTLVVLRKISRPQMVHHTEYSEQYETLTECRPSWFYLWVTIETLPSIETNG